MTTIGGFVLDAPPEDAALRTRKEWWAVSEAHHVVRAAGYSCAGNDGYWWVPALGFSMREGVHLHETMEAAIRCALADLTKQRCEIDRRENFLRAMLAAGGAPCA